MALLRKVIKIGDSKGIVIPHDYLEYYKNQGKIVRKVGLEIGEKITITPIFEKNKETGRE